MIEMKYDPNAGEVAYPTGPMKAGVAVEFHWKTPSTGIVKEGKNGRLQMVAPPGNNATLVGVFGGKALQGSGQTSWHFSFGPGYGQTKMLPDTDYTGTVTADADCAGCTLKLTAR